MPCGTITEGSREPAQEQVTGLHKWGDDITGDHEEDYVVNSYARQDFKSTRGECIPRYHARVKAGELLPHTNFEQFESSSFVVGTTLARRDIPGSQSNAWYEYHYPKPPESYFPYADGEQYRYHLREGEVSDYIADRSFQYEVQKAAARIYTQGHDTLTFLAELAKVRQMFANLVKRLLSLGPTKGDPSFYFKPWVKKKPGEWLEARYGWRTLIYDLQDLQNAMENLKAERKRFSERSGTSYSFNEQTSYQTSQDAYGRYKVYTKTDEVVVGVRGSVQADIEPANFQFAPILTAWELLPFSFVIDWLINIGQSLASIHFLTMNSHYVASGGYNVRVERRLERTIHYAYDAGFSGHQKADGYAVANYSLRIPTSVSSIPQIRVRIDAFKIADLMAILYQLLK